MTNSLTLVIDQGTFSTRALVFDKRGSVIATARQPVSLRGHGTDEVEQDAAEILHSAQTVISQILAHPEVQPAKITAAGLTTQRSSVVAWHRHSGAPLAPLLSWQDRRVAGWLASMADHAAEIKHRTGLMLSPHYGAGKLRWYLDHVPAVAEAAQQGQLAFGPLAAFLIYNLVQQQPHLVDHVNASRTQLWNLQTRDWDPQLLSLFNIPLEPLPACRPIADRYGQLRQLAVPLTAVNGDQNSAIYSLGRPNPETAIVNIGTGAFILCLTHSQLVRHPQLLSGLASSTPAEGEYLIEGTVNGAGAALDWAARKWQIADLPQKLVTWLQTVNEPPVFLNTIGGLGAPWWKGGPSPTLLGDGATAQRAVAVVESIIFMLQANLEAMRSTSLTINRIQLSGGLSRLDGLCQRLANLTQCTVYRPVETEATARGIAWLAAGQPEIWPEQESGQTFQPYQDPGLVHRYQIFSTAIDEHDD